MKNPLPLFALKSDLDMLISDVQEMHRIYGHIDWLVKVTQDCQLEQLAQGAQMRRIEENQRKFFVEMKSMNEEIVKMKTEIAEMKAEITEMKVEIASMKNMLERIVKHLGI